MPNELRPNHIHAQLMDVLAPLRGALHELHETLGAFDKSAGGCLIRDADFSIFAQAANSDDRDRLWDAADAMLRHAECFEPDENWDYPTMTLNKTETHILSVCLLRAIAVAYDEGFTNRPGSVIGTMAQLYNELNSGRTTMTLVFGTCSACWPARQERNGRPWTAHERLTQAILENKGGYHR